MYWLELLQETGEMEPAQLAPLSTEADELVAIIVASKKTARSRLH